MRTRAVLLSLLFFAAMAQPVAAQSTYRWVDADGKVHYGDRPPLPGKSKDVEERKYSAPAADRQLPYAVRQAMRDFPVTLYVTPDCGAPCKDGRTYLTRRGVPFAEKGVTTSEEVAALQSRVGGGDLAVPVLTVGSKNSRGFLEPAWGGLLDAAGYP